MLAFASVEDCDLRSQPPESFRLIHGPYFCPVRQNVCWSSQSELLKRTLMLASNRNRCENLWFSHNLDVSPIRCDRLALFMLAVRQAYCPWQMYTAASISNFTFWNAKRFFHNSHRRCDRICRKATALRRIPPSLFCDSKTPHCEALRILTFHF